MFNTQNVVYATYLANLQRNSYTKAIVKARGELNWSKDYTDFHEPPFQQPRSVLINNGKIGIEQGNDLLVYTIDGTFLYALTSPAFFGEKAIASVKNFLLNYFDYDKNVLTESIDIRGYEEFTALLLLRPLWDEIISATQYSGGPHREPPSFCVSRQPIDKFSATWLYEGEGAIKHAFLGNDEKTTIIIEGIKIITIDNASGSRSENTPIDYNLISTACLNLDNKLILTGTKQKEKTTVSVAAMVSLDGKELWSLPINDPQIPFPPACGNDGLVFIIDNSKIKCIKDGNQNWDYPLTPVNEPRITISADNTLVLMNAKTLIVINQQGEKVFDKKISIENESFTAPPAIGDNGQIFVASNKKLYCFR